MRHNLDLSQGAIFGEMAMMRLGETLGKHTGHELVHEAAIAAQTRGVSFLDEILHLPGGPSLRAEIKHRLEGNGANGICAEYAIYFGSLVEDMTMNSLPAIGERRINAFLKAEP
jgi:adenylosuccinate lyase